MTNMFSYINKIFKNIEEVILCIGIIILAIFLNINVIARKQGMAYAFYVDELAMFLVIIITFIGISYAVREGSHIRMSAIFDILPETIKRYLMIAICLFSAMMLFHLTYLSVIYVLVLRESGQIAPALGIPYWIGNIIVPIGFFLTAIQYLIVIYRNIKSKETWVGSEKQSEY